MKWNKLDAADVKFMEFLGEDGNIIVSVAYRDEHMNAESKRIGQKIPMVEAMGIQWQILSPESDNVDEILKRLEDSSTVVGYINTQGHFAIDIITWNENMQCWTRRDGERMSTPEIMQAFTHYYRVQHPLYRDGTVLQAP